MVYLPEGEFLMGSENDPAEVDERPQHTVYLDAFWIDQTEVTNAQYEVCVESGTCRAATECSLGEPTYADPSKTDHPVVCVSWQDAVDYCGWAGKRLPTEAEWEKAARGTDGRIYPWGNEWDPDRATTQERGSRGTKPVGSYPTGASPYGALDMVGNAWEWVADWYEEDYYSHSPDRNPTGPDSGEYRVIRGHSWTARRPYGRCAFRRLSRPELGYENLGFRCCVTDKPSP